MNIKSFPIPVVGIGPGSQPADPDLQFMPLPRDLEGFDMPYLPTANEVSHLAAGKAVIAELIAAMRNQIDSERYPVLSLQALDSANRQLINQLLGEGEVSALVRAGHGGEIRIQESVFAGVWRVLELDTADHVIDDRIEVCPIPACVWQTARATGAAQLTRPDTQGVPLMNALPVVEEIAEQMRPNTPRADDQPHIINFSLLPMSPDDLAYIDAVLGAGYAGVFSRGYGKCRVMATRLRDVWRVQYFNGMNGILLDTLEITRIPEVTLASAEDLDDSLTRLEEAWAWLNEQDEASDVTL